MSKKVTVQMLSKCQYRKTGPKSLGVWEKSMSLRDVVKNRMVLKKPFMRMHVEYIYRTTIMELKTNAW
jgi:hypothetical protein